jgi:hypothetical protein
VGSTVHCSSDAGISWTEIFNSSWIYIKKVIYDPITSTVFIAGSDDIVHGNAMLFYSRDLGNTWISLPLGIADPIIDLDIDESGWIYFATPDSGVFRFNPVVVQIESESQNFMTDDFLLLQNYPNPFNPRTVISWQVSSPAPGGDGQLVTGNQVDLKIFDLLGQKVRTLIDEWQKPGFYSVIWDGLNDTGNPVSSGIYFCQLRSGNLSKVTKMILSR